MIFIFTHKKTISRGVCYKMGGVWWEQGNNNKEDLVAFGSNSIVILNKARYIRR